VSKIAPLGLVLIIVLIGASYAAEKIVLVCSGTSSIAGTPVKEQSGNMTLMIDLDRRIVTNS
jgi:hypothetical protein